MGHYGPIYGLSWVIMSMMVMCNESVTIGRDRRRSWLSSATLDLVDDNSRTEEQPPKDQPKDQSSRTGRVTPYQKPTPL